MSYNPYNELSDSSFLSIKNIFDGCTVQFRYSADKNYTLFYNTKENNLSLTSTGSTDKSTYFKLVATSGGYLINSEDGLNKIYISNIKDKPYYLGVSVDKMPTDAILPGAITFVFGNLKMSNGVISCTIQNILSSNDGKKSTFSMQFSDLKPKGTTGVGATITMNFFNVGVEMLKYLTKNVPSLQLSCCDTPTRDQITWIGGDNNLFNFTSACNTAKNNCSSVVPSICKSLQDGFVNKQCSTWCDKNKESCKTELSKWCKTGKNSSADICKKQSSGGGGLSTEAILIISASVAGGIILLVLIFIAVYSLTS